MIRLRKMRMHFSIIIILVFSVTMPIWTTSGLTVNLSASSVPAPMTFKFLEAAFVEYPKNMILKDLVVGKNYTISFTRNSNNTTIQDSIHQLNTTLANNPKKPSIVTDLEGHTITTGASGIPVLDALLQAYSGHTDTMWGNVSHTVSVVIMGFTAVAFWIAFFRCANWRYILA